MKRTLVLTTAALAVLAIAACSHGLCNEGDSDARTLAGIELADPAEVFRASLPEALRTEIAQGVEELVRDSGATAEQIESISAAVTEYRLRATGPDDYAANDSIRASVWSSPRVALLAIESVLRTGDDESRQKAAALLAYFTPPSGRQVGGAGDLESGLVVPLALRCGHDTDDEVRATATSVLRRVARRSWPSPGDRVMQGLKDATGDDAVRVRRAAALSLLLLGRRQDVPAEMLQELGDLILN